LQSLFIGASVVILGAIVEKLHSPMWLITYAVTLLIYVILHVIASLFFHFHSLIQHGNFLLKAEGSRQKLRLYKINS
jgi:hypothetical protein